MQVNRTLLSAFAGAWLIERSAAESIAPVIHQIMQGKTVTITEEKETVAPKAVSAASNITQNLYSLDEAPAGSVAIIPLKGVMMREDSWWFGAGTETVARWINAANQNPNISAIVLQVNSGGGAVDGTEALAHTIGNSTKPVVTLVQGVMASAAYWAGSKGSFVMLEGKTSMVGSIGTQLNLLDFTKYYESLGIQEREVTATESVDKNEAARQIKKDNYAPIRAEILDPLNSVFLAAVQDSRAGKLNIEKENPLTGKVYVGEAAVAAGLADGFGTLEDAVQKALELANDTENANPQPNSINQNSNMKKISFLGAWTALLAFAGLTVPEGSASVEGELTPEQLADINAKLEENKTLADANASLTQKVSDLEAAAATAATEKNTLEQQVADLTAKVKEYGGQPAATHTSPKGTGSELSEETEKQQPSNDPEADAFGALGALFNKPL